ncbi:MAG: energy-coupling factor transporter ATPase [Clostridia bacterium]|nr:energy-coupling factor transporter ATPase [Clostridia bacterium]
MPIKLDHLTHVYQAGSPFESGALEDIDFTIEDGELLALIGHTGSGKSTLAQHLNGLLAPTSGRVLVDGQDINDKGINRRALRQRVGLLFQYPEYQLFEETVYKDIAFGPKNQGLSGMELDERVREAFASVHLPEDVLQKSPFELSGGQMRRVALAGVVAMRPSVLVLDEPIAGLDPKGRDELTAIIRELHEAGVTIVLISHNMDDVARIATRVAVLEKGHLAMLGTPAEVFARGDELEKMGLDVPQTVQLCRALRAGGLAVPDCLTGEALADAICAALKGGAADA